MRRHRSAKIVKPPVRRHRLGWRKSQCLTKPTAAKDGWLARNPRVGLQTFTPVAFYFHRRHCASLLSAFSRASNEHSSTYRKGRIVMSHVVFSLETARPRVRAARPLGACVRNVKFSRFYVNCSTPSGACHPSPPQGHAMHAGKPEARTPEQQQSVFTMLFAAMPKGMSSPDHAARTCPGLYSGECGVEDCLIEMPEHHELALKSLKIGVRRDSASRLAKAYRM